MANLEVYVCNGCPGGDERYRSLFQEARKHAEVEVTERRCLGLCGLGSRVTIRLGSVSQHYAGISEETVPIGQLTVVRLPGDITDVITTNLPKI